MLPTRPTAPRRRARMLGGAVVLIAAIWAAYGQTLQVPFIYDDTLAIVENPTLRRLWPLSDVLLPLADGGLTVSGRPVLNLSFALNHALSGSNPWSYHVFNILLHTGSALLVLGIARRSLGGNARTEKAALPAATATHAALAIAIAMLWALHPVLTQAVTYTVQRAESMMACFFLLSLYAFIRAHESRLSADSLPPPRKAGAITEGSVRWWSAGCVGACILGVGSKEVMATAPLVILLYDRTFLSGTFGVAWRRHRPLYLALASTWLLAAALVASTGGNRGGTVGLDVGITWWAYPLTQFKAAVVYLARSFWPHPLTFEYGTFWVRGAPDVLPYALGVAPLFGATIWLLHRRAPAGFCAGAICLILAPSSLAPGTIQMIVEHRIYLPLAAGVGLVVVALHTALGRRVWPILGCATVVLAALTFQRNATYRSALQLWGDTVAKRPENPRAREGLAEALEAQGRWAEGLAHREIALRLQPDDSATRLNLARTLAHLGRNPEAISEYRETRGIL